MDRIRPILLLCPLCKDAGLVGGRGGFEGENLFLMQETHGQEQVKLSEKIGP